MYRIESDISIYSLVWTCYIIQIAWCWHHSSCNYIHFLRKQCRLNSCVTLLTFCQRGGDIRSLFWQSRQLQNWICLYQALLSTFYICTEIWRHIWNSVPTTMHLMCISMPRCTNSPSPLAGCFIPSHTNHRPVLYTDWRLIMRKTSSKNSFFDLLSFVAHKFWSHRQIKVKPQRVECVDMVTHACSLQRQNTSCMKKQ